MQSNGYVVGFAAAICVVCSLLLSGVSSALKEKQEQNRVIDRQKNILVALGWKKDEVGKLDAAGVTSKYKSGVQELVIDAASGKIVDGKAISALDAKVQKGESPKAKELALYKRTDGQEAYALPFTGKGLWSTLYGYLALKPNGDEIVGVTYYKHGETPGLGAEIEAEWFLNNFVGKKLYKGKKFVGIKVAKGLAKDQPDYKGNEAHMVDGMSGATLTGNGVMKMMTTGPKPYGPFFSQLKAGGSAKAAPAPAPKPAPAPVEEAPAAAGDAGVAAPAADAGAAPADAKPAEAKPADADKAAAAPADKAAAPAAAPAQPAAPAAAPAAGAGASK